MTREEYLAQLRALLTGRTPPDELERILAYYTEYFDEAGPQGEGRVIRELGTPAELVGRVLGAQRSRTVPAERDCPPEGAARERHGLGTLWKVLLAICAAPIAIPLILVVVAMVLWPEWPWAGWWPSGRGSLPPARAFQCCSARACPP